MLRRLVVAPLIAGLLALGALAGAVTVASASSAPLMATDNPDGTQTLVWSLRGSSDQINVLPNLRCEMGPEDSWQFSRNDPCLWLVDHLAPLPTLTPIGCLAAREPGVGGPAPYASWRCDMDKFRDVVIHASQVAGDRSFVMFNTQASGGSGRCATIPITVRLGAGHGQLQARDGCPQTIVCDARYGGLVLTDSLDAVSGCPADDRTTPTGPTTVPNGARGGGGSTPVGPGSGGSSGGDAKTPSGAKATKKKAGKQCPGASSGTKGNSPLYSVLIRARGKRGMKIYVHLRRAVPITVDVRMRRGKGRRSKIVRWVSRCGKKGTNLVTLPNATGGAQSRRNYRVYVKSPNSTYPLRSSWEALPRR